MRLRQRASSSGQLVAPDASLASPAGISPSVSPSDAAGHSGVMRPAAPPQLQAQQQRRWTTGAVAGPRAPPPPPRRASTGSLRDTPSSRWRSRRYRLSTLTMEECIEAAAVSVRDAALEPQASTQQADPPLTPEPCLGQLAAEAKTGAKASLGHAVNAENADPQLRFVTERRRPRRKPLEAAAREHAAAAAHEAGLTSLAHELSATPEPRTKPPLHITLPPQHELRQPTYGAEAEAEDGAGAGAEAEDGAPAATGGGRFGGGLPEEVELPGEVKLPAEVELRRLRRPPEAAAEEEDLAQISPRLAQMQISPAQISPDSVTAPMRTSPRSEASWEVSPLRAADLADSPFAQIAKKMREHEQREARGDKQRMEHAQREAEQRQAEAEAAQQQAEQQQAAQQEAARPEAAAQLASPSPRAAQAVAVRTCRR